jgi:hypothetical protein
MMINGHWCWSLSADERKADATVDRCQRKATRLQRRHDAVFAERSVNGFARARILAADLRRMLTGNS